MAPKKLNKKRSITKKRKLDNTEDGSVQLSEKLSETRSLAVAEKVVFKDDEKQTNDERKDKLNDDESISDEELHYNESDRFNEHFNYDLHDDTAAACLNSKLNVEVKELAWPIVNQITFHIPSFENPEVPLKLIEDRQIFAKSGEIPSIIESKTSPSLLNIKSQVSENIRAANMNATQLTLDGGEIFTPLQRELFTVVNNYQDLLYTSRTFDNSEEIRFVYCLHALNHVLKTRTKILHHNAKMQKRGSCKKSKSLSNDESAHKEFRDQGLVRPKVLILVPFKDSAKKIIDMFMDILVPDDDGGQVVNKKRFLDDFTGNELSLPKKKPKPLDYEQLFTGNIDDTFRMGISITKKTLKLYADFYSSDIIVASPLGLRMIVKAAGESDRDFDFLASIEVLVLDQTEQFLMQNWDHFAYVCKHLHMQPKKSHGTDFSRVRMWSINGWSKFYRQTLIFSAYLTPEISNFFNKNCHNYAGKCRMVNPTVKGNICAVTAPVVHVYKKFMSSNVLQMPDARFNYFAEKLLPSLISNQSTGPILIYVPSYFDYVKIRNYFKSRSISHVKICEYSRDEKVAKARDLFFHGEVKFLLYSERFHHFHRVQIKGVRHIVFYQLPNVPHYYAELCNFMHNFNQNKQLDGKIATTDKSVTVIYCKYDSIAMSYVVGCERTVRLLQSDKETHLLSTSD